MASMLHAGSGRRGFTLPLAPPSAVAAASDRPASALPAVPHLASGWSVEDWHKVAVPCFDRFTAAQTAHRGHGRGVPSVAALLDCFYPRMGQQRKARTDGRSAAAAAPAARPQLPGLTAAASQVHRKAFAKIPRDEADPAAWLLQQLLPSVVAWAAEFPSLFSRGSGGGGGGGESDELWHDQPNGVVCVPQPADFSGGSDTAANASVVEVPVYALPLLTTVHARGHPTGCSEAHVSLTRRQCRSVLAASFLGLGPRPFLHSLRAFDGRDDLRAGNTRHYDVGEITWEALFACGAGGGGSCGVGRVACQLHYFEAWRQAELLEDAARRQADDEAGCERTVSSSGDEDDGCVDPERQFPWHPLSVPDASTLEELVTFHRVGLTPTRPPPNWAEMRDVPVVALPPSDRDDRMPTPHVFGTPLIEQFPDAQCHVDFANRQIQIGQNIPSCTQEEVMFSIRPELFLCLPLFTTILDHEAAGVAGAAVFTAYTGYLTTFRFAGGARGGESHALNRASRVQDDPLRNIPYVSVIDAHVNRGTQFGPEMHTRDLNKAFVGFDLACSTGGAGVIATGPWGCGAFFGDLGLKFVQQVMAAAAVSSCDVSHLAGSPHAAIEESERLRPKVALRYHDSRLGPVFAAYCSLFAHLDVSVAALHDWVLEFGLYHARSASGPAGFGGAGNGRLSATGSLSGASAAPPPAGLDSSRRGAPFNLQAMCHASQDPEGDWPTLPGEDPMALVRGDGDGDPPAVDDTGLVPRTMGWYWAGVVAAEAEGLIGMSTFTAFLGFKLGSLVHAHAKALARDR
jgi:hypothetical protein